MFNFKLVTGIWTLFYVRKIKRLYLKKITLQRTKTELNNEQKCFNKIVTFVFLQSLIHILKLRSSLIDHLHQIRKSRKHSFKNQVREIVGKTFYADFLQKMDRYRYYYIKQIIHNYVKKCLDYK